MYKTPTSVRRASIRRISKPTWHQDYVKPRAAPDDSEEEGAISGPGGQPPPTGGHQLPHLLNRNRQLQKLLNETASNIICMFTKLIGLQFELNL